jgi:hypothetical protein
MLVIVGHYFCTVLTWLYDLELCSIKLCDLEWANWMTQKIEMLATTVIHHMEQI